MTGGSDGQVPALFTEAGNLIGSHYKEIGAVTGILAGILTILNTLFGVQLTPYGNALVDVVTADSFLGILLIIVLISQVMIYQRIEWVVEQLETGEKKDNDRTEVSEQNEMAEQEEIMTDGGGTQPRDDKGRFTTEESGGSNLLLILLGGAAGYLIATEYTQIEPVVGILLGIAAISILQASS